jgi:hypothetical protein
MKVVRRGPLGAFFSGALAVCAAGFMGLGSGSVHAQDRAQDNSERWFGPGHWRLFVSPYASFHWRPSDEHKTVWAIGFERHRSDDWLAGASHFSNSFGQPSAYLYIGKRWDGFFGRPELFAQATGGLLYGYRGKYEDKVPLNNNGFSPGAVLTGGWQFNRQWSVAAHLLGDAAVMFQLSYDLR